MLDDMIRCQQLLDVANRAGDQVVESDHPGRHVRRPAR